jgi:hypothetical protein
MLKESYLNTRNLNGQTYYMRYTSAGGRDVVTETIQWRGTTGNLLTIDTMASLKEMAYDAMNNNTEQYLLIKETTLNPIANKVNIGIAYDRNNIYLVQDFETNYITWNTFNTNNPSQITLQGTLLKPVTIDYIGIFYDKSTTLTVEQLNQAPYNGNDPAGKYVAIIVPPAQDGYYYDWSYFYPLQGVEANTWTQNGNNFQITFSLNNIINNNGKGIYTIYLTTDKAEILTNYSIWIKKKKKK